MEIPKLLHGYEVRESIGHGGFGAVYRAYQPILGRDVAIKVILPEHANNADFIRRFESEAQLIARLEHPHIVPLYDFWREPDGAFLVMRWIRGGTLKRRLQQGDMGTDEALAILEMVTSALFHAHSAGVVHLDIKPDNILIDENDNAYLTDFGISQLIDAKRTDDDDLGFSGTIHYAAPEQFLRSPFRPQTDIYSLAFVVYEMLSGKHPFEGLNPSEMIFCHINEQLPDICRLEPELPPAVQEVLAVATEKDPDLRYADVRAFMRALDAALRKQPAPTREAAEEDAETDVNLRNPYKGLRAFGQADADDFFGRRALVEELVARLAEAHPWARFLAVVGPSGSGKSSVVSAGLVPALRYGAIEGSGNWYIVEMVPGNAPLRQLEAALLSVAQRPPSDLHEMLASDPRGLVWAADRVIGNEDTELLLVIDQFEEVFTLVESERERTHFLHLLQQAATAENSRVRIVITLRADFYDRPLLYENTAQLVQARTQIVLPLNTTEIQAAVTGPAQRQGVQVDADLLAEISNDVSDGPGSLPLLQYALTELFRQRDGKRLTLAAYRKIGGLFGTLAKTADDVYNTLSPQHQQLARQIFIRLVTLGEGTEDTRRRVRRAELLTLSDADDVNAVLDAFGKVRLLTFDAELGTREPMVEVAHEALIQTWGLLRGWIQDSREDIRLQRQLAALAADWEAEGRNASYLARGSRLQQLVERVNESSVVLAAGELAYIEASQAEAARQAEAERVRQEREARLERRSRNVLRALVVVFLLATIGALALTAFALGERGEAQTARATSEMNAALAGFSAATATNAQGEAIAQAVTATVAQGEAVVQAATAVAARNTSVWNQALAQTEAARATALQGEALDSAATSAANVTLAVVAQATAQRSAEESQALALAASAQRALTGHDQDLALALAIQAAAIPEPPPEAVSMLSDAVSAPGTRRLYAIPEYDPETGIQFAAMGGMLATLEASLFLDDAGMSGNVPAGVATSRALYTNEVAALSAVVGTPVMGNILAPGDYTFFQGVRQFAVGPRSQPIVAIGSAQLRALGGLSRLYAFDAETGNIDWQLGAETTLPVELTGVPGVMQVFTALAYSSDGQNLLVTVETILNDEAADMPLTMPTSQLLALDPASGDLLATYPVDGAAQDVVFAPNGQFAVIGTNDGRLLRWTAEGGAVDAHFDERAGHRATTTALAVSPSSAQVASVGADGGLVLWDAASGDRLWQVDNAHGQAGLFDVDFTPDGHGLVTAAEDGGLTLWDAATGSRQRDFSGHTGDVLSAAVSPDGQVLASGGVDSRLLLWDIATGAITDEFAGHNDVITMVRFDPQREALLSASGDMTLRLWDYRGASPALSAVLAQHEGGAGDAAYSPDGRWVLSVSSKDSKVLVMDATTGEMVAELTGLPGVSTATFTPDGQRVVGGAYDQNGLLVWDIATGEVVERIKDTIGGVNRIRYSGDGRYVAVAEIQQATTIDGETVFSPSTNQLTLRDADHFEILFHLTTPRDPLSARLDDQFMPLLSSAVFSPDGRWLIAATMDGDVLYWNLEGGELERRLMRRHDAGIWDIDISPDGTRLLTGSLDGSAILWDVDTGEMLLRVEEHTDDVIAVGFSPAGDLALTASENGQLMLWEVVGERLRLSRRLNVGPSPLRSAAFSPDGRTLVTQDTDGNVRLWETAQTADELLDAAYHTRYVRQFSCDERDVYRIEPLCDADGATPVPTVDFERTTATPTPTATPVLSPTPTVDPRRVTPTPTVAPTLPPSPLLIVYSVPWSGDGTRLASANADGTVRVFDAASGEQMLRFDGHTDDVIGAQWSPDDARLLTVNANGAARVWSAETGDLLLTLAGHEGIAYDALWSPDGERIVTGGTDGTLRMWDAETGDALFVVREHVGEVRPYWSPDGTRILTVAADMTGAIWDADTGEQLVSLPGHGSGEMLRGAWSPDGARVATTGQDTTTRIWDAETGEPLLTLQGHGNWVIRASWSPDGRYLATTGLDSTARIWDTDSGEAVWVLDGFDGWTAGADWTQDGRLLVTSLDGTARVVDVETGETLLTVSIDASFYSGRWSPDGARFAIGATDGYARIWDGTSGELLVVAPPAEAVVAEGVATTPRPTSPSPDPVITADTQPAIVGQNAGSNPVGGRTVWAYEGTAGEVLTLRTYADWDTQLRLFSSGGALLAENNNASFGGLESLLEGVALPENDRYLIEVTSPWSTDGGRYRLEITSSLRAAVPTPTATPDAVGTAQVGNNRGQVTQFGGAQVWQYKGVAGETLSLEIVANWDTVLTIRRSDGRLLAENDDLPRGSGALNLFASALPEVTLPADGYYQIEVRGWDNRVLGPYTLVVASTPPATPTPTPET